MRLKQGRFGTLICCTLMSPFINLQILGPILLHFKKLAIYIPGQNENRHLFFLKENALYTTSRSHSQLDMQFSMFIEGLGNTLKPSSYSCTVSANCGWYPAQRDLKTKPNFSATNSLTPI